MQLISTQVNNYRKSERIQTTYKFEKEGKGKGYRIGPIFLRFEIGYIKFIYLNIYRKYSFSHK